jgi:hypothetical protein
VLRANPASLSPRRFTAVLALSLAHGVGLAMATAGLPGRVAAQTEHERNAWPVSVRQSYPLGRVESWTGAGPFLFKRTGADTGTARGFRPFWVEIGGVPVDFRAAYFLYPLFSYTASRDRYQWSVFELIRRSALQPDGATPAERAGPREDFEVWPFWFSRQTGDPRNDYRALFPLAGTIKGKLGFERLSWTLFPLYAESEKRGAITTFTPWPVIRVTRGAAQGFAVWPLFGAKERPGVSREEFYLWPLGYNVSRWPAPDDPSGTPPRRDIGALPFYARSTGPGYINEDFVWPFFGYTDRTAPKRYQETRYLWPFLVQGRGDERWVNRWGPFYTHSIVKGYDKTWYAWPLLRYAQWQDAGLVQTKTQLLYFLYWSTVQRSATNPTLPAAELRHVWPVYSGWDNGAGRRQWQFPSPLEVFFPGNERVRLAWTPFFTLLRYDQQAPGEDRTSLLWNAVTWQRSAKEARTEFHLGPLFSVQSSPQAKRIALGNGLIAWKREPAGSGWRLAWLDFPGRSELRFSPEHQPLPAPPTNRP